MALVQVLHLTFGHDGSLENLFDDVSFQVDTDWKLGLTGRNGRGKTTLLRLLMGQFPYQGRIFSPVPFDYFPFDVPDPSRTARETVMGIAPECTAWELSRELSLLAVSEETLDRPFTTLSHGERTKLLLIALFLRPNRFLLIDEPTNHLDEAARRKVSEYLRAKKGFILVSHDRAFLDNCVDHILSIGKARIDVQKGDFSSWWRNKEQRDRHEKAENEKLRREIGKLSDAVRQTAVWSDKVENSKYAHNDSLSGIVDRGYIGHKAAKMMKRSKAIAQRRQQAVEDKSSLLKDVERVDRLTLHPMTYMKPILAEVRGLTVQYGEHPVFQNLDFVLRQGERVALCGRNGCGKSSLLRLVMGEPVPHRGTVRIGGGLVRSYISQDIAHLAGRLADYVRAHGVDEPLFRAILSKLEVQMSQWDRDMRDFSDGQKKKVLLARSLCEPAHLYVWDEPLNFVDVISRMQVEELIRDCRPTMLLVEHDHAFLDAVATRRVEMGG